MNAALNSHESAVLTVTDLGCLVLELLGDLSPPLESLSVSSLLDSVLRESVRGILVGVKGFSEAIRSAFRRHPFCLRRSVFWRRSDGLRRCRAIVGTTHNSEIVGFVAALPSR